MSNSNGFIMVVFMVLCGSLLATTATINNTWKDLNSSANNQQETLAPTGEVEFNH